jgi:CheY-like chemotaxis protein
VHIYLPRAQAKPDPVTATPGEALPAARPGAGILLVDDDGAVRDVTAAMLREMGYSVLEAANGDAALALLDGRSDIDLAVIDLAMPGMSGAELARHVHARRISLPVLFVTGFAEREALTGVSDRQIVSKPFVSGELGEKVRMALTGGPLQDHAVR